MVKYLHVFFQVKVPTLFILGAQDRRVPVSNGLQVSYVVSRKKTKGNLYYHKRSGLPSSSRERLIPTPVQERSSLIIRQSLFCRVYQGRTWSLKIRIQL